jgi:serine/threonine protein phosphatase PrpC/ankyrin repeat protein
MPADERTFKLRVGESGDWCQEGTLVSVVAGDLEQLCARVGESLGLVGVQVEIFDSDFDEWVGPFALDDVPAVASVRVRAQSKLPPPPEPEPPPPAAPPALAGAPAAVEAPAAADDAAAAHVAKKLRSLEQAYQIGALSEQKYLLARARLVGTADAGPPAPLEPEPEPPAPPAAETRLEPDAARPSFTTAEEAAPPPAVELGLRQQARDAQTVSAQGSVGFSTAEGDAAFTEPQAGMELDPAEELDAELTPEELAELAFLYPQLISEDGSPVEPADDESQLGGADEASAESLGRQSLNWTRLEEDDIDAPEAEDPDGPSVPRTPPKRNLGAEAAMREREVRLSIDTAKRRAQEDAEERAVAADWRGLGQWVKGQTDVVVKQRQVAEAAVEEAVREMWLVLAAQEEASSAISDARHRSQRRGLLQRRAGTVSGRGGKKFAPMFAEVKAGTVTWLSPADAAAADAAGLALSQAAQDPPAVLSQCSVRYLSSAEAAKAILPTPHVFRLELATVDESKPGASWLLALDTAEEMMSWIEVVKHNSQLAQQVHELQERKEETWNSTNEYQTKLVPAAVEALTLALLTEKRDLRLSGFNSSINNGSTGGGPAAESGAGPKRSTSPAAFGAPVDSRSALAPLIVQPSARFACGHADDIGKRPTMEDCSTVYGCFRGFATEDYFAVFDGHGGTEVAEYAAQYMHQHLEAALAPLGPRTPSEKQMHAAFTTAFAATNEFGSLPDSSVARSCGSTVVVAVVINTMLHVANAGDARVVLCRTAPRDSTAPPKGIRLSVDHKPGLPEERQRIEAGGGSVIRRRGVDRVEGFLAVSRALGDLALAPHVSCAPYTSSTKLGERDEYLILACDGVWDVLTDDAAAAIVCERAQLPKEKGGGMDGAAQALVDISLQKGSTDNVTVHVVALKDGQEQKEVVVGSVANAMVMMDSMPAAPAPAPLGVKKKRRGKKRIGAGAVDAEEEDTTSHCEDTQAEDPELSQLQSDPSDDPDDSAGINRAQPEPEAVEVPLQLEPLAEPELGTPPGSPPASASAIDPTLFALATASPPPAEDRGGSNSPRSKEVRRQAFAAAVQRGDELATDDPAGAVHAYMEALELGTAGERLQVGRSLSNAQLLLCKNLAREAVRSKDASALSQLIGAVGARASELVNTFFDEEQGVTLAYFAAQENDHETLAMLLEPSVSSDASAAISQPRGRRGSLQSSFVFGNQYRLADRPAGNGGSPLFVAAKLGNSLAVGALIKGGCEVDAVVTSPGQPIDGLSALLIATRQGHREVVEQLLRGGADPNQRMSDGTAPIHVATSHGHASIIRSLSKAGADLNARKDSKKQVTPLLSAAQLLNANTVEALVDGGADLSRQVYTPSGEVQTTLRYAFGVAMRASRSRPSAISTDASKQQRESTNMAEQAAAKKVMDVLQRASRRPVVAAHQRLSLAKLLPRGTSPVEVRHNRALSKVFNRVAARMPLPTCEMTVQWVQQMPATRSFAITPDYRAAVLSGSPLQKPTSRLNLGSASSGLHAAEHLPTSTQRPDSMSMYGSPRHETRRWQEVEPHEWSTELVRQWSVAVLGGKSGVTSVSEALAGPGTGRVAHSSRLVSAGLTASMVDGEALLAVPSFRVLHSVIGSDIEAGPVLRLWGALQRIQIESGLASSEESASKLASEQRWQALEDGVEKLVHRRSMLKAAVSQASMELHTDRILREGLEAELAQMRSQVEWAGSHLATPTRPRRSNSR